VTTWVNGEQRTIPELLEDRLGTDPDSEYLDICGSKFSAGDVNSVACRIANGLGALGIRPGDRVATLIENSPEAMLSWWGAIRGGFIAVPINTAFKGRYLRHQLNDAGAAALIIQRSLYDRLAAVADDLSSLQLVVVIDDEGDGSAPMESGSSNAREVGWKQLLDEDDSLPDVHVRPSDIGTFVYTGGTTGPSKGCMLSHNYHEAAARQIGICWGRQPDDVLWTPLPLFHYNALTTAVLGALIFGGRSAVYRKFSVSNFWSEMNRTGATITSTLGSMAYLLANDIDRPEMPKTGEREANATLRMLGAAPMPLEVDTVIRDRFGIETFSGAFGLTEASLISWSPPGVASRPNAAGIVNSDYFDVRIFDDQDNELPPDADGEIVIRPKRPHVMFEGYWGRPDATVSTSRNWWYHTGDIGRIDNDQYLFFVDRKADYLRRRGENISSFEVESVFLSHGDLADVAVHAVPSQLTEDDLKVTATLKSGGTVTEEELFKWSVGQLPYFALPRYIEFRDNLPRSELGRVLKRQLRDEGVTDATWDADESGITVEKR
jgi:crotonobetaine/carnitine-CoA ligase